jgi:hypothetical protein
MRLEFSRLLSRTRLAFSIQALQRWFQKLDTYRRAGLGHTAAFRSRGAKYASASGIDIKTDERQTCKARVGWSPMLRPPRGPPRSAAR